MENSRKDTQKKASAKGALANSRCVEIDDDIPPPRFYKRQGKGNFKYPWNEMEINQSFFVPGSTVRRFSSQVQAASKRYKKRFILRNWIGDDDVEGVRVWRVE